MSSLGQRIRGLREGCKLSQKRLAEILGISNVQLSRYETGDRKPDPELVAQIADYFEVSTDYLFSKGDKTQSKIPSDAEVMDMKNIKIDEGFLEWVKIYDSCSPEERVFMLKNAQVAREIARRDLEK